MLVVEWLRLGGAERQLCTLAAGLARRGWAVTLAALRPEAAEAAPLVALVQAAGVTYCRVAPPDALTAPEDRLNWALEPARTEDRRILRRLPAHLILPVATLLRFLRDQSPDRVVCTLDRGNVIGGVAAALAGVPGILLSARNVNPTHFPHFFAGQTEDFRALYRALLTRPGVRLAANAARGAASYAEWLGIPPHTIPVIANGVAASVVAPVPRVRVGHVARRLGIRPRRRILLGVFRLSPEKCPFRFLEIVRRVAACHPDVHAVICGTGPLKDAVQARIAALGLSGRITLAGAVADIPVLMRASHLLLHVPDHEGTPNVLLEAQALGLPVVSTRSGGSVAVLAPVLRRWCRRPGDVGGLTAACLRLLADDPARPGPAARIRGYARRRWPVSRLVADTLAVLD